MRVIARGYRTPHLNDLTIISQVTITPQQVEGHDGLKRGLWWEFEYVPNLWDRLVARIPSTPTAASTLLGGVLTAAALLGILALAGWVEGL